ncbi:hypothetical protein QEZ52_00320 [Aliisedimentitalea scapharcae]|uniref:Uncharacterized protein n=1 Tax=Aliisedimentitalea scapharcae TaxID=1524259 RepID=A0ABZ2XT45_9RHOB
MEVRNTTKGDLGLGQGYVVPAGGTLEIDQDVLEQLANSPVVQAWEENGWIVEVEDKKPSLETTRESIAEMGKAEMIELLEAHGVEVNKRLGEEKLREQALSVVFIGA